MGATLGGAPAPSLQASQNVAEFLPKSTTPANGEVLKAFKDELGWQIMISLHDVAAFKYFRRQLAPVVAGAIPGLLHTRALTRRNRGYVRGSNAFNEQIFEVAAG